jgi:histone acetyltransferase 1
VEDPSDDFVRLRDFVDSRSCMSLDAFQPKNVMRGYSLEMVTKSNEEYKICRRQARRVYEILRLNATNKNNKAELEAFRSDVKARLSRPFLVRLI